MDDRKRKWVYWSTFVVTFILWSAAWSGVLALAGWLLTQDPLEYLIAPGSVYIIGCALWLSTCLASQRCRRLGLSLEGDATESQARQGPPVAAGAPERVTTGTSPRSFNIAGIVLALLAAGICAGVRPLHGYERMFGYLMAGIFGGGALACWLSALADAGRLFMADEGGVTRCAVLPGRTQSIPWERIGRYHIRSRYNTLGRNTITTCTLYDTAGRVLAHLNLSELSERERARFLDAIRARHGVSTRPELIAADAPAGLGTEPEAAPAPAGRGTEPEADREPAAGEAPQAAAHRWWRALHRG